MSACQTTDRKKKNSAGKKPTETIIGGLRSVCSPETLRPRVAKLPPSHWTPDGRAGGRFGRRISFLKAGEGGIGESRAIRVRLSHCCSCCCGGGVV